jgi:hypothetical protein
MLQSGEHQQSHRSDCSRIDNINRCFFCRARVYGLVRDLHRVGIVHEDLEPRNIARAPGGGFRLIFQRVGSISAKKSWYDIWLLLSLNT